MERHKPFNNGKGKGSSGHLRKGITEGEGLGRPRRPDKPIRGAPFYRQRPMGQWIVDFSAPKANLVVQEDGSQPKRIKLEKVSKGQEDYLSAKGIEEQRLNANEVVREIDTVARRIYEVVKKRQRE